MRTIEQLRDRLQGYTGYSLIHDPEMGYVVWRKATGDNLEILFIEAADNGKGLGEELVRRMVRQVKKSPPYHSVFAVRLGHNWRATRFYGNLGFCQVPLGQSIYRDDTAVLCWTTWTELLQRLGIHEDD